jgi:DNA-binding phage protein
MGAIAKAADVDRANLYRALSSDTNPEFETIRKVLAALGVQFVAKSVGNRTDSLEIRMPVLVLDGSSPT